MQKYWSYDLFDAEDSAADAVYMAADVDALVEEIRASLNAVCNRRDEMALRIDELQKAIKLTHDTLCEAAKIAGMSPPPPMPDRWLSQGKGTDHG